MYSSWKAFVVGGAHGYIILEFERFIELLCNTSALIVLSHNDRGVLALIVKKK